MLRIAAKYKSTVLGTMLIVLVSLSMLSFGVNYFGGNSSQRAHAIDVNGERVSYEDFYKERGLLEERYRASFGDNYAAMAESLSLQISQSTADQIISDLLLKQFADKHGFVVSDTQIRNQVRQIVGEKDFSAQNYAQFLSRIGLSARELEAKIRQDLIATQLANLVKDLTSTSLVENDNLITHELAKHDIVVGEFKPDDFASKVPPPTDEEISRKYSERSAEFEAPAQIAYEYYALKKEDFPNLIQVSDEELEMAYSERGNAFKSEDEASLTYIGMPLEQKTAVETRKKSDEVIQALKKGEPFGAVVKKMAISPSEKAGLESFERLRRSQIPSAIQDGVFSAKEPYEPFSVETGPILYIATVKEVVRGSIPPYAEIKDKLRTILEEEAAPAFYSAKASELYSLWTKSNLPLVEFLKQNNLSSTKVSLTSSKTNPDTPSIEGSLTNRLLAAPQTQKQLVDLATTSILTEITQHVEPTLRPLEEVKGKIIESYKVNEQTRLAREAATKCLEELQGDSKKPLGAKVKECGGILKEEKGVSKRKPGVLLTSQGVLAKELFDRRAFDPKKVIESNGSFFLLDEVSTTLPSPQEIESERPLMVQRAQSEASQALLLSLLNREKARAKTDIDSSILNVRNDE
jgi:SurA N-terminal domain